MCPVRTSTRSSRHAQLLPLYTHFGAGMSLPLASCCSCCISQSNLHANKRKGRGLPNQLKTRLLPTCQIFRDKEIPDIPEVAPNYGCVATFELAGWRRERIAKWEPDPRSSNGGRPN